MSLTLATSTEIFAVRRVLINCPVCGRESVPAMAHDVKETILLFRVLPVFSHKPTRVECFCGARYVSALRAVRLTATAPGDSSRSLHRHIPLILRTLTLAGLVVWILPGIGFLWTGATCLWAWRYPGWIRALAFVEAAFATLSSAALLLGGSSGS